VSSTADVAPADAAVDAAPTPAARRCLLVSDFTTGTFAGYLANHEGPLRLEVEAAPYGQVMQALAAAAAEGGHDALVVWTRPEGVIPTFARALAYERVDPEAALAEVDAYADALLRAAAGGAVVLVPGWELGPHQRGWGMLDLKPSVGVEALLMRMTLRLAERVDDAPSVFLLNARPWMQQAGADAFSPKLWYLAKVPFGNEVFREAAGDVYAALQGAWGMARKLVVLDLDDTLWGGIVGDIGWEALRLGGHDAVGEAFVEFQHALRALTSRGILLGLASKNEEAVALEAIDRHPEMVLTRDHFAGWRINWNDKAQNIADLAAELNLGLQSVVFIDDNPVERDRVREALPEVYVPEWPKEKMHYTAALQRLRCFDTPSLSDEDTRRARMYVAERRRGEERARVGSVDEWLGTLGTELAVEPLHPSNRQRVVQLLNKTNQMNLATRRMTEPELAAWADAPGREVWAFRVSDRFGDAGLTGIASLETEGDDAHIVDFVLSCRVMGRQVEEAIVATLVEAARARGAKHVHARYLPTAKNVPCLRFWADRSGWDRDAETETFTWDAERPYPFPAHIRRTAGEQG
jgi:FkbH-like protein